MWSTLEIVAHHVWQWLPHATTILQFGTALITFAGTAAALVRRSRHRR